MEEKITLGRFIAQKRKDANLTQKELADKLYVTESAVSKWERGISYPDIALITNICNALNVTEHELITASEDYSQREADRRAKSYQRFVTCYKWIGIAIYGVALITCFICNLSIQHTLSWFFIVLTAEMTAFSLTTLPSLLTKNRATLTLGAFFVSLNLLLMTCAVYSGGDWFFVTFISILFGFSVIFMPFILKGLSLPKAISSHKTLLCFIVDSILLFVLLLVSCLYASTMSAFLTDALPYALAYLIYPWSLMVIIRYTKINWLFKVSSSIFITGVFTYLTNALSKLISQNGAIWSQYSTNLLNWSEAYLTGNILLVILLSCIALSVAFAIGGIILSVRRNKLT